MPAFCKNKSKVKMVMLTKPGMPNIIWYSFLSHDKQPENKIIAGMKGRFEATPELASITQKLNFYDNLAPGKPLIDSY